MILITLARRYAPHLAPRNWQRPGDLRIPLHQFARQLARSGVLVLYGDRLAQWSDEIPGVVQECAGLYVAFYRLLAMKLFPRVSSTWEIEAHYFSLKRSALVIFYRANVAVIVQAMAGYIVPYVTLRQADDQVSALEAEALMERMLQRLLEGEPIDRVTYAQLKTEGAHIIQEMLTMRLHQLSLLRFDEPMFRPRPPTSLPNEADSPTVSDTGPQIVQNSETSEPPPPPAEGPSEDSVPPETGEVPTVKSEEQKPKEEAPSQPSPKKKPPQKGRTELDDLFGEKKGGTAPLPYYFDRNEADAENDDEEAYND
jgi:hypothetical protein